MSTTDPLHDAFEELARLADLDAVPDRLAGIAGKRRAQRHRRAAVGAGVATLAVVVSGVALSALPGGSDRSGEGIATTTPEPTPAPDEPRLEVALRVTPAGDGTYRVGYDVTGTAVAVRDPGSKQPVDHGNPLGTRVLVDGKETIGTDGGAVECDPAGRVETYDQSFTPARVSIDPGRHTVEVRVPYCTSDGRLATATDRETAYFMGAATVADRARADLDGDGAVEQLVLVDEGTASALEVRAGSVSGRVDLPSDNPVWISGATDLGGDGSTELLVDLDQGDLTETVVVGLVGGRLRLLERPEGSEPLWSGTKDGRFYGAGMTDEGLASWSGEVSPDQPAGSEESAPRDTPLVGGTWMPDGDQLRFTGWSEQRCGGPTVGPGPC